MKKHMKLLLLSVLLVVVTVPAQANYREDFLYLGHYMLMRTVITPFPRVPLLGKMVSSGGGMGSGSFYADSGMPAWDFDVAVGADYIDSEQMGIGSNTFESRTTNWYASMQARKDRWTLGGTINRQSIVGKGVNGTGLTQRTTGLTLMPGYQILTQAENGVNLDVDAILDMSYTTFTHNPSAWYVRPGAKVAVNRLTKAGLFQVAGIYTHLRNISGDSDQFTTNSGINSYGAAFDYICLFTKEIYGNIGLSYLTLDDMPSGANTGMDDELTDVNVRAGGAITERLSIDGGYFQAIDGRDTQGFSLRGAWTF